MYEVCGHALSDLLGKNYDTNADILVFRGAPHVEVLYPGVPWKEFRVNFLFLRTQLSSFLCKEKSQLTSSRAISEKQ